jgi:anti-anti-sigma regulatory factor
MSHQTTIQTHIAYELLDDRHPHVVVVTFLSHEIAGPTQAHELREQLESLIRPELPHCFVIDFGNVRAFGSTAFGEIVAFAQKVGGLSVCNMRSSLRFGAAMIGLERYASPVSDRSAAIDDARKRAARGEADTGDYPVLLEHAVHRRAELTLEDFGGRSDALGG